MSRTSGSIVGKDLAANATTGIFTVQQALTKKAEGNWPASSGWGQYEISRSLRFNSADTAYLSRTPSTPTDKKIMTFSFWVKKIKQGSISSIYNNFQGADYGQIVFDTSDRLEIYTRTSGVAKVLVTTQRFRDPSAWYHIFISIDTTQATESDRWKLYVNGERVTAFDSASYPTQNSDVEFQISGQSTSIGRRADGGDSSQNAHVYLTEYYFIDGQALTPSDFGETDGTTGVWKPKAYIGTYGTNGFYLNFSDNSNTTSATLGKDQAGSNDWTPNNFSVAAGAGNDSLVDTPTPYGDDTGAGGEVRGNYSVLTSLTSARLTVSDGGLSASQASTSTWSYAIGSIAVNSGKWYFEAAHTDGNWHMTGVDQIRTHNSHIGGTSGSKGIALVYDPSDTRGDISYNAGNSVYTGQGQLPYTAGQIIGIALDLDNNNVKFYKNNTLLYDLDDLLEVGAYYTFGVSLFSGGTATVNFGQRPFAYTAPSGFKALCTQNLPNPTIADGSEYFNTVLYTGNGSTQSITGVGFQPDWVWIKERSQVSYHVINDAVRGAGEILSSNDTLAEDTNTTAFQSFNSDGFTVGVQSPSEWSVNGNTTYVAWNWNAGGSNATNTDGTITSTVRANPTAGFSIVSYTGNGSTNQTAGHGLGVKPKLKITKSRSIVEQWVVTGEVIGPADYRMFLNTTAAVGTAAGFYPVDTTTTIGLSGTNVSNGHNQSGQTYISYVFAEVEGYSKFGSFVGNNSSDGLFLYLGFRPAFLLFKRSGATSDWTIFDSVRGAYNANSPSLAPNTSAAESAITNRFDIVSNGVKFRSSAYPNDGTAIIYAAFAENPFKYSLAR